MPPNHIALNAEQTDDLLYFARTGSLSDLIESAAEISTALSASPAAVLGAAVDEDSGNTVLHMAAANGHADVITHVLLALKEAEAGSTAGEGAASAGRSEDGADVGSASNAASMSSTSEASPNPDATREPTETATSHPLVNAPNRSSSTPLHWAALNGHLDSVRALADGGADLTLENAAKHDALDEAERAGRTDVARFLTARLSGKSEEEILELERKRAKERELEGEGSDGVKATQEDLEKLGLEGDEEGA